MSIQDDAFDVDNIFQPRNDDGDPVEHEVAKGFVMIPADDFRVGMEAWDSFRKHTWQLEAVYDSVVMRNRILSSAIKIVKNVWVDDIEIEGEG
jgi:hypothetical protein